MRDFSYFSRQPHAIDGRTYGERTRQAVLRTASNVRSYRGLVDAFAQAKDGTLITISEKIVVPETLLIKSNRITITCLGRGALVPSGESHYLFHVVDVDDVFFDRILVLPNKEEKTFEGFIDFSYQTVDGQFRKNIYIQNCLVNSQVFLKSTMLGGNFPKAISTVPGSAFYNDWTGNRTFITGNIHKSLRSDYATAAAFLWGENVPGTEAAMFMASFSENESNGYMSVNGSGNIIVGNAILGAFAGSSVYIDTSSSKNIISSNLVRLATNVVAGNAISGEQVI